MPPLHVLCPRFLLIAHRCSLIVSIYGPFGSFVSLSCFVLLSQHVLCPPTHLPTHPPTQLTSTTNQPTTQPTNQPAPPTNQPTPREAGQPKEVGAAALLVTAGADRTVPNNKRESRARAHIAQEKSQSLDASPEGTLSHNEGTLEVPKWRSVQFHFTSFSILAMLARACAISLRTWHVSRRQEAKR